MTEDKASEKLIEALEEAGYDPQPYSGRGMYGERCVSISGDGLNAYDVGRALAGVSGAAERAPRSDSVGRDVVLYWPRATWPAESAS